MAALYELSRVTRGAPLARIAQARAARAEPLMRVKYTSAPRSSFPQPHVVHYRNQNTAALLWGVRAKQQSDGCLKTRARVLERSRELTRASGSRAQTPAWPRPWRCPLPPAREPPAPHPCICNEPEYGSKQGSEGDIMVILITSRVEHERERERERKSHSSASACV